MHINEYTKWQVRNDEVIQTNIYVNLEVLTPQISEKLLPETVPKGYLIIIV